MILLARPKRFELLTPRFVPCLGIPSSDLRLNPQTSNNIIQKGLAFARERSGTVTGSSRLDAIRSLPALGLKAHAAQLRAQGGLRFRAQSMKSCAARLNSSSRSFW